MDTSTPGRSGQAGPRASDARAATGSTGTSAPEPPPASETAAGSPWAPLRIGVFRAMWIAALVSNVGSWMHLVAGAWLMTSLTASAALVALLQSANALPGFLLSLPGGAMADVFDRRRLILATQSLQLVVAADRKSVV